MTSWTRFMAMFVACLFSPAMAIAGGLYIGGALGNTVIQDTIPISQVQNADFDANSAGFKGFVGLRLDSLAVEASYLNFGKPDDTHAVGNLELEISGFDLTGLINFSIGPIDLFGRGGLFVWESKTKVVGIRNINADGADLVLGLGIGFNLGSLGIRGEVERFDVDDVDDVYFISLGIVHTL